MVCPLSSEWWDGIANHYYKDEMRPLLKRVEEYARNAKPTKEVKRYIEQGGWKARMGGRGLPNGGNRVIEQVCNNTITFKISQPTNEWIGVAPILGVIIERGDSTGIQRISGDEYEYHITETDDGITVSYAPFSLMDRFIISHLRGVAYKCAYCIGCKACEVQCPTGAFVIKEDGSIYIREALCIHCSNCLGFIEKSCLMAKSLTVTGGWSNSMDMKGMNPYQHFGFRQAWLEHFFNEGLDCFQRGLLGTRQYDALKVWLREANIVSSGKNKTLVITDLGKRLAEFGPYNPFTWAVIWANLTYSSVISRWYCLNAEIGATYEKGDLVVMIGDNYSQSNRENAITALAETLRQSPIGTAIKQGIPIELSKNTFAYYREGWQVPDGVALLYALYLYAEHTGRRAFTFNELANSRNNPDATGISPHDIFGIDVKAFREQIQGLAIAYPQYIHVAFKDNLDNIILEDSYLSVDVLNLKKEDQ